MPNRDGYSEAIAKTINKLFSEGLYDPSAREIAVKHFRYGLEELGGEVVDSIRKRLPRIKRILEQDYDHPVSLVSGKYYKIFKDQGKQPESAEEASMCLPGGNRKRSEGIKLNTGGDDLIFIAMLEKGFGLGGGKVKEDTCRLFKAVGAGRISKDNAVSILNVAKSNMTPENTKVLKELDKVAALLGVPFEKK